MMSALLSSANLVMTFAASTASPLMNAIAVGPVSKSSRPSMPASLAAILKRVFLATEYSTSNPRSLRSSCSWDTVRPRYSVNTTELAPASFSFSSARSAVFFGFAIVSRLLPKHLFYYSAGTFLISVTRNNKSPVQEHRARDIRECRE